MAAGVALLLLPAHPVRMAADAGSAFWFIIVGIYVLALLIGAIRRAVRSVSGSMTSQPRMSVSERYAEARREAEAAKQTAQQAVQAGSAALADVKTQAATLAAQLPAMPVTGQQVRQDLVEALAQVLRTQTAGTVPPPPMPGPLRAAPVLPELAPQPGDVSALLPAMSRVGMRAAGQAQAPLDFSALVGRLATPSGLAFAILAATIIGTPPALRSEPQEPGGW